MMILQQIHIKLCLTSINACMHHETSCIVVSLLVMFREPRVFCISIESVGHRWRYVGSPKGWKQCGRVWTWSWKALGAFLLF